jgi:hypothetical protein
VGDGKEQTTIPVSNLVVENSFNYVLTAKKKGGGITRKYKCPLCKKGMKLVGMSKNRTFNG